MLYFTAEECIGVFGNVIKSVMTSRGSVEVLKLIDIPAASHTKMLHGFKRQVLCEHTKIEFACLFNNFTGEISHLTGNCNFCGVVCDLEGGVYDTAVVPSLFVFRSQDK